MGNRLITETVCEICGEVERREGQFEDLPKRWRTVVVCPKHVKAEKRVRGKDKQPRRRAPEARHTASASSTEESIAGTVETHPTGVRKLNRNCVGCKEQKGCFKEDAAALDCWNEKSKNKKLAI